MNQNIQLGKQMDLLTKIVVKGFKDVNNRIDSLETKLSSEIEDLAAITAREFKAVRRELAQKQDKKEFMLVEGD